MINTYSNAFLTEMLSQNSSDPFILLATFSHDDLDTLRLARNVKDITSRSNVFTAFPFDIVLPIDDGEQVSEIQLILDNVGLEFMVPLRSITTPADVIIEGVLASTPDVIELSIDSLKLKSIVYDENQIKASLTVEDILNTEIPSEKYEPAAYRGMFA